MRSNDSPQRSFRQCVKFVEKGRDEGRIQCHEDHGHSKNENPEIQGHIRAAVQQDPHEGSQQGWSYEEGQQLALQHICEVKP